MSKTAIANIGENDFDDWRQMFVDFAIAYALLNFVSAIVVSRYLNRTIPLDQMEKNERVAKN